ncbi:PIG-L deacetylase family protein [Paenibacillus abyssi]|uniref:N-acetyl-alpha-D-glucosaminyl L-malate deacetylase 2 n=1 Tax=Paenibacillus abyssi TaxID=1340531 RepID=A0A917FXU7_9BACL|nr:PIG-L family deacetylase [Paenibacillus abyssi]GGG13550.1 putative N-acetyl-alpha-D-glucosaminyl L-malate deacetylase 2 [Paenibacillus abyssi]
MKQTVAFLYAHPDDETFLSGCLIRQLADEGHIPVLLLATKGDAGKKNGRAAHLSNEELAVMREKEMEKAADILGISNITYLNYLDGKLNTVDEQMFVDQVVRFLNEHRPKVIVTFPENGGNYHPDHIAISQITTSAVLSGRCPSVEKLYYAGIREDIDAIQGQPAITVDTNPQWNVKAEALRAHQSQIFAIERYFGDLNACPENRRHEAFTLRWERGADWPNKAEQSLFDGM